MTDPEKPVPPPDIPKPDIPPPDLPKPEIETPPEKHAPAVAVRVRQPGDPVDDHTPDAGVATFNTRVVAALIDFLVATGLMMAAFFVLPDFLGGLESRVAGLLGGAYLVTGGFGALGRQVARWLVDNCRLVALSRHDVVIDWAALNQALPGIQERVIILDMPELEIASHAIRARCKLGQPIRYQVPRLVETYIRQNQLYGASPKTEPHFARATAASVR